MGQEIPKTKKNAQRNVKIGPGRLGARRWRIVLSFWKGKREINHKHKNMKELKIKLIYIMSAVLLMACGGGASKQEANADGFEAIEEILKSKFGDDAHYTDLTITYNKAIGNIIGLTVTKAPESLQMDQWSLSQDNWTQTSEITLEVPQGTQAADFMFQLNKDINLGKLGKLVEKSKERLTAEKEIENPSLHMALINMPKNGDRENTQYVVMLKPENGGTTFTFNYDLDGALIQMDY